jgi:tryptophan synthase alpha chain
VTDRIAEMFERTRGERRPAVIVFAPAGWPELDASVEIVEAAIAGGADAFELGMPFSDPLADGVTNQEAYQQSLAQGTTPVTLFDNVRRLRARGVRAPLLIMGYFNPLLAYGVKRFVHDAAAAGVDGLIIVDLPPGEAAELEEPARAAGLKLIFLLAPTSTDERIRAVAEHADGFIYCVSVTGVTGARDELPEELSEFMHRVRAASDLPLAVGFGISTRRHVEAVAKLADAAVIGSAFVRTIADGPAGERTERILRYLGEVTGRAPGGVPVAD